MFAPVHDDQAHDELAAQQAVGAGEPVGPGRERRQVEADRPTLWELSRSPEAREHHRLAAGIALAAIEAELEGCARGHPDDVGVVPVVDDDRHPITRPTLGQYPPRRHDETRHHHRQRHH